MVIFGFSRPKIGRLREIPELTIVWITRKVRDEGDNAPRHTHQYHVQCGLFRAGHSKAYVSEQLWGRSVQSHGNMFILREESRTKPCSGTHGVNVVEGNRDTPGGGVSQLRWKELDTDCKIWISWHRTGRGGEVL